LAARFHVKELRIMDTATNKLIQYLTEAHALEQGLTRELQAQILLTPSGRYRSALESHHDQTREQARRLRERLDELGAGRSLVKTGLGLAQNVAGQALAIGRTPLSLVRGGSAEEKVLKNAKDSCAAEALEIATYEALERLAQRLDDKKTARLAAQLRDQEQKMLDTVRGLLPELTDAVVDSEVHGKDVYDPEETGAGQLVREARRSARKGTKRAGQRAKGTARQARRVPGVAQAEGEVRGAVASADDLAIAGYDSLTAEQINERLSDLPQVELAKIDGYERRNQDRATVTGRVSSLRGDEPWTGYDEMNADEITKRLSDGDDAQAREVREYEQRHKNRSGVLQAAERQPVTA